jgi:hypothetical protein
MVNYGWQPQTESNLALSWHATHCYFNAGEIGHFSLHFLVCLIGGVMRSAGDAKRIKARTLSPNATAMRHGDKQGIEPVSFWQTWCRLVETFAHCWLFQLFLCHA